MADVPIRSFAQLHRTIEAYGRKTIIYRGVTDISDQLIPEVGRHKKNDFTKMDEKEEKVMLRLFKEQALPYLNFRPANEWEWLAIARHHGLPTRLLDWTRNPLIGAYFAVEKEHTGDGVVYAYHSQTLIRTDKITDPFAYRKVGKFSPPHVSRRITAQVGVFTIHPNPLIPFKSRDVDRLIIQQKFREDLKWTLYKYGIHRASLFPDQDGLASHIKWLRTDVY